MNARSLLSRLALVALLFAPGSLSAEDRCFECTQVIGYSQVGSPRGGWYVVGGIFESIVGDDHWQLLWNGGAGVDRWQNPDYPGWRSRLVSPCRSGAAPDRVVLSISGPYGDNERAWAQAIEATIAIIRQKIPTARQIVLQPVVGGPEGRECRAAAPARGGRVRASWQHRHIENAIKEVVARRQRLDDQEVQVIAGFSPTVRTCDDYTDALGHLTEEGARAAGRAIGEYYTRLDAECRKQGHPNCGKTPP